jgi:hypothetical protein
MTCNGVVFTGKVEHLCLKVCLQTELVVLVFKNEDWDHKSLGFEGLGLEVNSVYPKTIKKAVVKYLADCWAAIEEEADERKW